MILSVKIKRKFHKFTTGSPITSTNNLSRAARRELQAAGILAAQGSRASAKRLIARGALAAAFSGALLFGAGEAMAEDFGFTYYGGSNPLADVTAWQAAPAFVDIDNDGDMDCFIGDEDGYIEYWNNKGSAESPEFIQITGEDNPFSNTCVNDWAAPAFVDIDGDGDMDAFVGHFTMLHQAWDGGSGADSIISFFENTGTPSNPVFDGGVISNSRKTASLGSNPLSGVLTSFLPFLNFADVDGDGDMDAVLSDRYGWFVGDRKDEAPNWGPRYFANTGSATEPEFVEQFNDANPFNAFKKKTVPGAVVLADLDNDQDPDAIMGDYYGKLYYYRNVATVEEALEIVKYNDDWLCFVEGARHENSLWESMADSCRRGAQKVRAFLAPSRY
ncbi:hypothetical protein Dalk_2062 [Desulfatibacillum aliphaticivorans]|uniref:FG-GAP repeat protein n=1 Tax=Desulfatibacillum aliphaticivorans TaxID=218208 RepID=B8FG77_DESAL|nr:VCBS repeat-containing protein [Desulfatibacillum aliphaticivorans]ACL03757.1 hypothetical protein Dalk_2062 [Desulfatibacillum aliphaticivorans]